MKIFNFNTLTLEANLKYIIIPVSALLVVTILIIITLKTGFSKVPSLFEELRVEQQNNDSLTEKLTILEKLESGILSQTDSSLVALPDSDSVLWFLNVLKTSAENKQIVINSIDIKRTSADVNSSTFELEIEAVDRKTVLAYITDLKNRAPVSLVEEISFESSGESVVSYIMINTYWKALPGKIPALTQPVNDLTQSEQEVLEQATRLTRPEFTILEPETTGNRTNPFY